MIPKFTIGVILGTLVATFFLHDERTESVFVYGTLTNPVIRSIVCWCYVSGEITVLSNYKKVGLNIVPDEESSVVGQVIKIDQRELQRLDIYERVPKRYSRKQIVINGNSHFVYQLNSVVSEPASNI